MKTESVQCTKCHGAGVVEVQVPDALDEAMDNLVRAVQRAAIKVCRAGDDFDAMEWYLTQRDEIQNARKRVREATTGVGSAERWLRDVEKQSDE